MSFASNAFAERGAMRTETVESALVRQAGHSFLDAQFRRQRVRVALVKRLQLPQGSSVAGDLPALRGVLVVVVVRIADGAGHVEPDRRAAGAGKDVAGKRGIGSLLQVQRHLCKKGESR